MPSNPSGDHAAYCEEYNEDAHTTIPETRQSANVAAKRSKPDIPRTHVVEAARDEFSDSGYSSRTGATPGSGDSSLAWKTEAAPLKVDSNIAGSNNWRIGSQDQVQGTPQSPRKPTLRRTESKARGGPRQQRENDGQERIATLHQPVKSLEKGVSSGRQAVNQVPQRAPEASSRPASTKPLPPIPPQNDPIIQPAQVRPRVTTSQSYRTGRPMSFHAGVMPQISYVPPLYIAPVAYSSPAPPPPAHQHQTASYFAPQQSPSHPHPYSFPPSSYDPQPHPPTKQWTSGQPRPYRHSMVYSPAPVINYAQQPTYVPVLAPTQHLPRPATAQPGHQASHRERHHSRDEDYHRMPPPPPPQKSSSEPQQHQRPSIRHAATTSATLHHRSGRMKDYRDDLRGPQNSQKEKANTRETSKRPAATKRPSTTSSNNSASSTHAVERELARQGVESNSAAKQRRTVSYHGHESHRELERSVEVYQASTGTSTLPTTADLLNTARKKTASSNASSLVSGSGRASREGSDIKPRSSTDRRGGSDLKARNDNDGLTMRFNASHGVNLDLKEGSVEGRTISLRQSRDGGDGEMEFSIGAKSSRTNSTTDLREKGRKRYSFLGGSGIRELEPAVGEGRQTREAKANQESQRKVAGSRSRRSSRTGRG